ncbi:MAG: HAD-IA family hydrolase [Pseudomonadota bacterium]
MTALELIVWDFDGVLNANVVDGRFVWADDLEVDIGISPDALRKHLFADGKFLPVVRGEVDLLDVVATMLIKLDVDVSADDLIAYWFEKDAHADERVLAHLSRPYRHVIGTNNEALRAAFIEGAMGLGARVEHVFASGRIGVAKPDEAYFRQIEAWSGLSGAQIALIDDAPRNVEAAEALGWRAHLFTENGHDALTEWLEAQ